MFIKILFFLTISIFIFSSHAIDLTCSFNNVAADLLDNAYNCEVKGQLGIRTPSASIDSILGSHTRGRNNDNVLRIASETDKTVIHYIPKNLATHFKNIEALRIKYGKLKEIHQSDFSGWANLRAVNFDNNNIEVLEDDLFKFNVKIERIWLEKNNIKMISATSMINLINLKDLDLTASPCGGKRAEGIQRVGTLLWDIGVKCSGKDLREVFTKIDVENKIESEKNQKEIEDFTIKFKKLEIKNQGLITEVSNVQYQVNSLKNENEIYRNEISNQSNVIQNLNDEILNQTLTNEILTLKVENLTSKLTENEIELAKFSSQIVKLNLQLKNVTGQLIFTLTKSLHTKAALNKQISDLQDENDLLKEEIKDKNVEIEKLEVNSGNFSEIISQFEYVIREKEEKNLKLEGNFTESREKNEIEIGELKLKLEESDQNLTQILDENQELKLKLIQIKESTQNMTEKLINLTKIITIENQKYLTAISNIKNLTSLISNLQSNIDELVLEKNSISQNFNETSKLFQTQIQFLTNENIILTEKNSNLTFKLVKIETTSENLESIEAQKFELETRNFQLESMNNSILYIVLPFVVLLSVANAILIVACLKKNGTRADCDTTQVHMNELKKQLKERKGTRSSDEE